MTDDHFAYRSVAEGQARHGVVKHSNKEYVRGNDHTNMIEGFFSLDDGLLRDYRIGKFYADYAREVNELWLGT
jgi:hypothetical protein